MIDEKKLIEILSKNSIFEKITNAEGKNIFDIIDEQPKTDWIPCEERLPKLEGEEYLVCKENGTLMLLMWTKKGWNTCKEFNGTYFTKCEIKDVIAWQPLPQPYKKEGAE
jgi:hypothetical protein